MCKCDLHSPLLPGTLLSRGCTASVPTVTATHALKAPQVWTPPWPPTLTPSSHPKPCFLPQGFHCIFLCQLFLLSLILPLVFRPLFHGFPNTFELERGFKKSISQIFSKMVSCGTIIPQRNGQINPGISASLPPQSCALPACLPHEIPEKPTMTSH